MLLDEEISVKINVRNIGKLKIIYNNIIIGDIINIPLVLLQEGSHVRIRCQCDICGKEKEIPYQKYIKNIKNGNYYSCSSKCAQIKVRNTTNKKYGSDYYSQTKEYKSTVILTNNKKYGSDYYLSSKIGIDNIKEIHIDKLGVDNPFKSDFIKNKIKETNIRKLGVENPSLSELVKNKISLGVKKNWENKCLKYYNDINVISYKNSVYNIECDNNKLHVFEIEKTLLHNRKFLKSTLCTICNPQNSINISGLELKLRAFIESIYSGEIIYNTRSIISPFEIDIYLPKLKVAIEFNGLYWHNELKKEKNYHLNKYNLCMTENIELIQVWEDDWLYKNEIIKSILSNKIGNKVYNIYARKCNIRKISNKEANIFLVNNHLQGAVKSSINIGLYYNDELVSIMCFGKLRIALGNKDKNGYELYRYCNRLNTSIIGGGSKILEFFKRNINFNHLITYFDKNFGTKNLYERIGFKYLCDTKPNYFYSIDGIKRHRYKFRKNVLVMEGYDQNKTEKEIMFERGIYRVYNSGNKKYIMMKE